MADEPVYTPHQSPAPTPPYSPPPATRPLFGQPKGFDYSKSKPAEPVIPDVNHLDEIAILARSLHNVSPSGAQTVCGQILEHISALQVESDKTKAKV